MLRQKVWIGLAVVGLGIASVGATPAQAAPAAGWGVPNSVLGKVISGNVGRLLALRSDLEITDAQRTQIRGVLTDHREEIVSTLQSLREKRLALRDAVLSDDSNETQIRELATQFGQTMADAAVKASQLRGQIAPILTPEQQAKIRQFRAQRDASVERLLDAASEGRMLKP